MGFQRALDSVNISISLDIFFLGDICRYICPESGFRLGRWVANLRQRADFLSEMQMRDLKALGFKWNYFKIEPWDVKVENLKKYIAKYGDTLVPKDYVDDSGFRLGAWVDRMRQTKDTMNVVRRQELESLGFVWNKYEAQWNQMFELLREYGLEYGHVSPKSGVIYQEKPLGQWCSLQRQMYSRKQRAIGTSNSISDDRVEKLESISFLWSARGQDSLSVSSAEEDQNLDGDENNTQSSPAKAVKRELPEDAIVAAPDSVKRVRTEPI